MKNPLEGAADNTNSASLVDDGDEARENTNSEMTAKRLLRLVETTGDEEQIFDNIGVLAPLSKAEYGRIRGRLKEATDVNLNLLDSAVREAREELKQRKQRKAQEARRKEVERAEIPTIQVADRPSEKIVDDLCEAIEEANNPNSLAEDSFAIFRRQDHIVQPETDAEGRVRIAAVDFAEFDDRLSRVAKTVDEDYEPSDPTTRLVERVQKVADVPPLAGVTQAPFLRRDGSIVSEPGYDQETRLLYRPAPDMSAVTVPDEPTPEDVEKAKWWVKQAWIDHPFVNEASRTNTVALALSNLVRPVLGDANIPVAVVDSPVAGSGKDLLAQIAAVSSTGKFPGTMSNPSSDDEWRKQITAQLKKGERFVLVSDVTGTLDNAPLRRFVTTPWWSDRILGASKQVQFRADAVWCVTGNNLRPRGDMVRRCYLIRIDPEMERPELREDFKYRQPNWAFEHRDQLAAALLTLARDWIVAGRPEPDNPTLGSFEEWCRVVGGILQHAGYENFLGNQDELRETEFSEDNQWSLFLEAIYEWQEESLDGDPFTARKLADKIEKFHDPGLQSEDPLVGAIVDRLPERILGKFRRGEPFTQSLGKMFGWRKDRRFPGGWFLTSEDEGREGTEWSVRRDANGNASDADPGSGVPDTRSNVSNSPSENSVFEDESVAPF